MDNNSLQPPSSQAPARPSGPYLVNKNGSEPEEFSFGAFWRVLMKRRKIVLGTIVALVALSVVGSLIISPRYEATSRVAISRENTGALRLEGETGMDDGIEGLNYNTALLTQIRVLQSDTLATQVIKQLKLDANPAFIQGFLDFLPSMGIGKKNVAWEKDAKRRDEMVRAFQSHLKVKALPGTGILEVKFTTKNADLSAKVVNTLVKDYIEQNFKTRFETTTQAASWLSEQLDDLRKQVETSQEQLAAYQKEKGILGPDESNNIITSRLDSLNKQLTSAESERIVKEALYRVSASGNPEGLPNSIYSPVIANLRAQQSALKSEYAQATAKYGDAYPRVIQIKSQIAAVDEGIRQELANIAQKAEIDYRASRQAEEMLRASLDQQKAEANRLNDSAVRYTILKRDAESNRDLYQSLTKKLKEAGLLAGLRSANIRVVDPAEAPGAPSIPNIPLYAALSVVIGLLAGITGAFVWENMDPTISTPSHVELITGMQALGLVPSGSGGLKLVKKNNPYVSRLAVSADKDPIQMMSLLHPESAIAESYRSLRSFLMLSDKEGPPKVIAVTSPAPQEGKSTTCINFATVLAQQGARVLLVDGDLRQPRVHHAFGLSCTEGLSSVLESSSSFEAAVRPCPKMPNLMILPAGPKSQYPAELLGSQKFQTLLAQWRKDFDHVVIDTPPALVVTDAVVMASRVDSVLVVARSGQSTRQSLVRVREVLERVGAKIAGVVITDVDTRSVEYNHYVGASANSRYAPVYYRSKNAAN